jgi:hypothetical protein
MNWIKKNWILIVAAIAVYYFWDTISEKLGLSKKQNTPKIIGVDADGNKVVPTDWDKNADGIPDAIQPIK